MISSCPPFYKGDVCHFAFQSEHTFLCPLSIRPKHRKHLTTDWPGRKNYICSYPAHQGLKKLLSLPRRVNAKIPTEIFVEFKEIVPIGAGE